MRGAIQNLPACEVYGPGGASEENAFTDFSHAPARDRPLAVTGEPVPAAVERLVAAAEAGLRRLGFTERTIKDRRRKTRALIVAHLSRKD